MSSLSTDIKFLFCKVLSSFESLLQFSLLSVGPIDQALFSMFDCVFFKVFQRGDCNG